MSDMSLDTYTEVSRRIYNNKEGVCLEVGPDADIGELVQISTPNGKSAEFFGKTRLVMEPRMAKALAKALIECADELEEANRE